MELMKSSLDTLTPSRIYKRMISAFHFLLLCIALQKSWYTTQQKASVCFGVAKIDLKQFTVHVLAGVNKLPFPLTLVREKGLKMGCLRSLGPVKFFEIFG